MKDVSLIAPLSYKKCCLIIISVTKWFGIYLVKYCDVKWIQICVKIEIILSFYFYYLAS